MSNKGRHYGVHVRSEVLALSDYKCFYCGSIFTANNPPTMDHIVPIIKGGKSKANNLVAACQKCNTKKGSKPLGAMYRDRKNFEDRLRIYLGLTELEIKFLRFIRKVKKLILKNA